MSVRAGRFKRQGCRGRLRELASRLGTAVRPDQDVRFSQSVALLCRRSSQYDSLSVAAERGQPGSGPQRGCPIQEISAHVCRSVGDSLTHRLGSTPSQKIETVWIWIAEARGSVWDEERRPKLPCAVNSGPYLAHGSTRSTCFPDKTGFDTRWLRG